MSKLPAVTAGFWVIKILVTTLGETGGDLASMSLGLGYLASSLAFLALLGGCIWLQLRAQHFNPWRYWAVMIATTTVGTTLADFADRSLGIGYAGGACLLLTLLAIAFALWTRAMGSVDARAIRSRRGELYYWATILTSQTLGTALGDWAADSAGLGYRGAALVCGALLAGLWLLHGRSRFTPTQLFWAAFVLTRPLGAALGDWLDKPLSEGGLAFSRGPASLILLTAIAVMIRLVKSEPAARGHDFR